MYAVTLLDSITRTGSHSLLTLEAKLAALIVVPDDATFPAWWIRELIEEIRRELHVPAPEARPDSEIPEPSAQIDGCFTAEEVASLTRLRVKQVYELAKRGTIPSRKAGRRWLFPKRDFAAWLRRSTD